MDCSASRAPAPIPGWTLPAVRFGKHFCPEASVSPALSFLLAKQVQLFSSVATGFTNARSSPATGSARGLERAVK